MNNQHAGGFIQIIIILVLLVIILSLLGISLRAVFSSPTMKENFGFVGEWVSIVWNRYLAVPFRIIYQNLIKPIWLRFINALINLSLDMPNSSVQFNTVKAIDPINTPNNMPPIPTQ